MTIYTKNGQDSEFQHIPPRSQQCEEHKCCCEYRVYGERGSIDNHQIRRVVKKDKKICKNPNKVNRYQEKTKSNQNKTNIIRTNHHERFDSLAS